MHVTGTLTEMLVTGLPLQIYSFVLNLCIML